MMMGWGRCAAMIGTSAFIMFFLMYQLTCTLDHATCSVHRLIAALVMACVVTIVMLGFMGSMSQGQTAKIAVLATAAVLGVVLLLTNRSQALIGDVSFMRARSRVREIATMKLLIEDIKRSGGRGEATLPARPAVVTPDMEPKIREAVQ